MVLTTSNRHVRPKSQPVRPRKNAEQASSAAKKQAERLRLQLGEWNAKLKTLLRNPRFAEAMVTSVFPINYSQNGANNSQ
jgi:hypothetical protein